MVKIVSDSVQPIAGGANFTGYSRGAKPDISMKIAGEGFANIIDMFTGLVDQQNQAKISGEIDNVIFSSLTPSQQQQTQPGPTSILPDNVVKEVGVTADSLNRYKKGFEQGKVTESYYWLNVAAGIKRLKSKYPQYADAIDSMVQKKLGLHPQKEYIKSLFMEQEDALKQAQKDKLRVEELVQKYAHPEEVPGLMKALDDPDKRERIRIEMTRRAARDADLRRQSAELDYEMKQGKVDMQKAERVANSIVSDTIGRFLNAGFAQATGDFLPDYKNVHEWVSAILKDGRVDTQELAQIRQAIPRLRTAFSDLLNNQIYSPLPGTKTTLAAVLGPEKVNKIVKSALDTFDKTVLEPLTNGDYGLLVHNAKTLEDIKKSDVLKVMQTSEYARKLSVAKELVGAQGLSVVLGKSDKGGELVRGFASDITNTEFNITVLDAINNPKKGIVGHAKDMKLSNPNDKPAAINALINRAITAYTSKDVETRGRLNANELLFGDGNASLISSLKPKDREKVFATIVNEKTAKATEELAKDHPEVARKYSHWAQRNFLTIFKQEMDNIKEFVNLKGAGDKPVGYLSFDPKEGKFTINWSNPESVGSDVTFIESWRAKDAAESVAKLNELLPHVNRAIELGGEDPNAYFNAIFRDLTKGAGSQEAFDRMVTNWITGLFSGEKKAPAQTPEAPVNPDTIVPQPRPENLDTSIKKSEQVKGGYKVGNVMLIPNSKTHRVDFENTKPEVLDKLARAAEMAGLSSLKINSAYRDPETNRRVGGARHSRHMRGDAIDISVRGMSTAERKQLIEALIAAGFKGIGVYRTAIHADLGGKRTWGPSYHRDSVPKWARAVLKRHGYSV